MREPYCKKAFWNCGKQLSVRSKHTGAGNSLQKNNPIRDKQGEAEPTAMISHIYLTTGWLFGKYINLNKFHVFKSELIQVSDCIKYIIAI